MGYGSEKEIEENQKEFDDGEQKRSKEPGYGNPDDEDDPFNGE